MYSNFYHIPLRDMFVRRVLWNMPKIKPEDFKQESQDQTIPDSPQIPPLTPPTATSEQIVLSKRRKRSRADPLMDNASHKKERSKPAVPKQERKPLEHAVVSHRRGGGALWVPIPSCSSKELVKSLFDTLRDDTDLCRFCCDAFCRDASWGDPHLIACAKCGGKYHTFCVDFQPSKYAWRCYKCHHAPRPGQAIRPDDDPNHLCQFCNRQSPEVAGSLVEYRDQDDTLNFVHENCAFYSKGVIKRENQWFGLHTAVREANFTKCSFCHKKGASIPCEFPKCRKLFHYVCAQQNECCTFANETQHLFCDQHMETVIKGSSALGTPSKLPLPFHNLPPSSPDNSVPQSNKKKPRKSRKLPVVPDDGEDDNPSFQM